MSKTITLGIDGMTCGGCVNAVKNVLKRLPGVADAQVEIGQAKVTYDEGEVDEPKLRAAIEKAGYTPRA